MRFIMQALLAATSISIIQAATTEDLVIGDFESGKLDAGWTQSGTSFVVCKASDLFSRLEAWQQNGRYIGYNGSFLIHTKGNENEWNRPKISENSAVTSPEFTIERDYVIFRCGGMVSPLSRYKLTVDGKDLNPIGGNNNFDLIDRGWDVKAYKGKKARFQAIVSSGGRTLLRFDFVRQTNTAPNPEDIYKSYFKEDNKWLRPGLFTHVIKGSDTYGYATVLKSGDKWDMFALQWKSPDGHFPARNTSLVRAIAPALKGPWFAAQKVFEVNGTTEKYLIAASVVYDKGIYYMFYGAGVNKGENDLLQPPFTVNLATSSNGASWTRHSGNPLFSVNGHPGCLSVIRHDNKWIMYVGNKSQSSCGETCLSLPHTTTSSDLKTWTPLKIAISGLTSSFYENGLTSVFKAGNYFYMLGRTDNSSRYGRMRHAHAEVLRSSDPYSFPYASSGRMLNVFGSAQVLQDDNGSWWITHGGPVPTIMGPQGLWMADVRIEGIEAVGTVPQQSIAHAAADAPQISLINGRITVNGAIAGDQVSLFDGRGRKLISTLATGTGAANGLPVPEAGTYVVSLSRGSRAIAAKVMMLASGAQ